MLLKLSIATILFLSLLISVEGGKDFFITPESNSVVNIGGELCIQWRGINYKQLDPYRGYITFNLLNNSGVMYKLVENVDFMAFEGIRVNIPEEITAGNYRILAELESCKYGERAYFSEPFRIVSKGSVVIYQLYGISDYVLLENEFGFGNCYSNLPPISSFFPPQLECEEIPDIQGFQSANDLCSFEVKLNIKTLGMGIINIESIELENNCQLENEDKGQMSIADKQRLKDSVFCLSDTDCYPNEYCNNFQKKREISGYWLCQTRSEATS